MFFCVIEEKLYDYAERNFSYYKSSTQIVFHEQLDVVINNASKGDSFVLLISNNHILEHCINVLHKKGIVYVHIVDLYAIDKFLPLTNVDGEFTCYVKRISLNRPYLVHMETHINNRCNLNCKACNNFSPWITEDNNNHIESLTEDLNRLNSMFSIGRLFLLGGEPLLDEEWTCASVKVVRKILDISEVRLLTNGLLIPSMKESFWNCIRKNNIVIYITLYPPTMKRIYEIKECLINNNIKFVFGPQVVTFEKRWTDMPYEDAEYNSNKCASSGCHFFGDGIYSKCPDAATISYSDSMGRISEKSVKRIDDIKDGWEFCEELEKPSDMCRYCTIERSEQIKWGSSGIKPNICDWKVENREEYIKRKHTLISDFIEEKTNQYLSKCNIAIWGCGTTFNELYYKIRDYAGIKYLTDSNQDAMIKACENYGLIALAPDSISEYENLFYLIAVDNPIALVEICSFLDKKCIKHVHIRELLTYEH